ncbi:hypothetical Protein YC6258_03406 [Gynuella sunshinyii YC6258]|uniref:Uncharacterized protein n=1 Tax=Gynuella sunshinyii YC6258 TaxID=1445510 RepID=A0A0C5VL64_9GAMM|nr:hypothetical Protein YC6258_03406 [Gynuella sunshinyii YC6258]
MVFRNFNSVGLWVNEFLNKNRAGYDLFYRFYVISHGVIDGP